MSPRERTGSVVGMLALAASLNGCGERELPAALEENVAGTGSGGTNVEPTCSGLQTQRLAACWLPGLIEDASNEWWDEITRTYVVPDLTVVGVIEPDISLCGQGFPNSDPDAPEWWSQVTTARAAWELEDSYGDPWVVQFAIQGLTPDILSSGDIVTLRYAPMFDTQHGIPHGWVALERDGAPAVAFGLDFVPTFPAVPDLVIEPAQARCAVDEDLHCRVPRAVRATANGESVVVPLRESAEVGGIVMYNNRYTDNRNCLIDRIPPPLSEEFELGLYAPAP